MHRYVGILRVGRAGVMNKWLKVVGVLVLANWFGSAAFGVYHINNIKTVAMFEKQNPKIEVKFASSTLSFFDVLLTRDHKWEAVWRIDGERVKTRWERTYQQPIPAGVYFGLGSSTIKMLGFVQW